MPEAILENLPLLIVIAGLGFLAAGAAGKGIKGFGLEVTSIDVAGRVVFGVIGAGLFLLGLWMSDSFPGRSEPSKPKASASPSTSPTSAAQADTPKLSPKETVSAYLRAVSERDLTTAQRLMPSMNVEEVRNWLEGRSKNSPIQSASLVSAEQVNAQSSSVTIKGGVRFCRMDGSGTNELKQYDLALNDKGVWEIRISYAPTKVTSTRC